LPSRKVTRSIRKGATKEKAHDRSVGSNDSGKGVEVLT